MQFMDRPPRGGFFFDSLPPGTSQPTTHSPPLRTRRCPDHPSQSGEEFLRYSATAGKGYSSQISARSLSLLIAPTLPLELSPCCSRIVRLPSDICSSL